MNEYWISWYSVFEDDGGFSLKSPWWVSGWSYDREDREETIFVGAIRADSEDDAFEKIAQAYDVPPEGGVKRRFIEELEEGKPRPWEHEGTRFPLNSEWMEW